MLRQPIENEQLTGVLVRTAYHLVVLDYRRNRERYRVSHYTGVADLAEELRAAGFVNLYWTLQGCARWLVAGWTLSGWRHEAATYSGVRAFHKRRPPRRS